MGWAGFLIYFLSLFSASCFATEVDDTTSYYLRIADSEEYLNFKVQEIFDRTLATYSGCNERVFLKTLTNNLTGDLFYGVVERFANESASIDKINSSLAASIYKGTPFEKSFVGKYFGLGAVISIHGQHVGTDKLSHFLDIGHDFYFDYRAHHSIPRLLEWAKSQEEGILGFWTTGVKSYGDIAADMDGFRFWRELIGFEAHDPYFACENGSLKQVRKFLWSDWVSPAWTEAINCSDYSSSEYNKAIDQNDEQLEVNADVRFQCPIEAATCGKLRETYAGYFPGANLDMIISPLCK